MYQEGTHYQVANNTMTFKESIAKLNKQMKKVKENKKIKTWAESKKELNKLMSSQ